MSLKQKTLEAASTDDATQPARPVGTDNYLAVYCVCAFLLAAVWVVFGQTLGHKFISYDDNSYVYENPQVIQGLSLKGIEWAFTHSVEANWHPLTMMSHMLDCQWYGLQAGGHHLTSLLLHAATAILLFLVLREMMGLRPVKSIGAATPQAGALWPSAFVAAVFAIHPLRVESVAWVSERKDVLSGLFFMLTLGAYVQYVEKSKGKSPKSKVYYGLTLLFFVLGLMCKPMLVTVPFVLLLLDYWPLNRFGAAANRFSISRKLIVEKIPLIVFSIAVCVVTLLVQQPARAISCPLRISNALVSYVAYCGQMFYPAGLALLYPYPSHGLPMGKIILSLLLLVGVSAGAFCWRQKHPQFLMGWLWYLGMLVPVIGLVQVGDQARADRYTYLPQIGLYILLTWTVVELTASWRGRRWVLGGGAMVVLAVLITCARAQTTYWRDSESLWSRSVACTTSNSIAHNNLGGVFRDEGRTGEAIAQFQMALEINPDFAEAHNNLGVVFVQQGRKEEAITQYQKALAIKPDYAEARYNLGNALLRQGDAAEAISCYQKALAIKPGYIEVQNNLALVLATCTQASLRNGMEAVRLAERANQLAGGKNPAVLCTLAAAYAETGRFPEAIETAQRALHLAEAQSNTTLAGALQSQLKLYQAGIPSHGTEQAP
jgi:tetratricopeptide (TPR) repeat protein